MIVFSSSRATHHPIPCRNRRTRSAALAGLPVAANDPRENIDAVEGTRRHRDHKWRARSQRLAVWHPLWRGALRARATDRSGPTSPLQAALRKWRRPCPEDQQAVKTREQRVTLDDSSEPAAGEKVPDHAQ
jgi:hypothetical protein